MIMAIPFANSGTTISGTPITLSVVLGVNWDGSDVWVVGNDGINAYLARVLAGNLNNTVSYNLGAYPALYPTAVCSGGGYIYFSDYTGGVLKKFDPNAGAVVASIATGYVPTDIVYDSGYLYMTTENTGKLLKHLASDLSFVGISSTDLGNTSRFLCKGNSGEIWWTLRDAAVNTVKRFDATLAQVGAYVVANASVGITHDTVRDKIWVANDNSGVRVFKLNSTTGAIEATVTVSGLTTGELMWGCDYYPTLDLIGVVGNDISATRLKLILINPATDTVKQVIECGAGTNIRNSCESSAGSVYFGAYTGAVSPKLIKVDNVASFNIAFRSTTKAQISSTTTALAVPPGTINGELMIVAATGASMDVVTPPAGWSLVASRNVLTNRLYIYSRVASSEPASYNWVTDANTGTLACVAYSNATGVDVIGSFTDHSVGTNLVAPSITTTKNGMTLFLGMTDTSTSFTNTTANLYQNFIERVDSGYTTTGNKSLVISDMAIAAGVATGSVSAVLSGSRTSGTAILINIY